MHKITLFILAAVSEVALAEGQHYVPRAYYTINAEGHESARVPLRRLHRSQTRHLQPYIGPYPGPYPNTLPGANANANADAEASGNRGRWFGNGGGWSGNDIPAWAGNDIPAWAGNDVPAWANKNNAGRGNVNWPAPQKYGATKPASRH